MLFMQVGLSWSKMSDCGSHNDRPVSDLGCPKFGALTLRPARLPSGMIAAVLRATEAHRDWREPRTHGLTPTLPTSAARCGGGSAMTLRSAVDPVLRRLPPSGPRRRHRRAYPRPGGVDGHVMFQARHLPLLGSKIENVTEGQACFRERLRASEDGVSSHDRAGAPESRSRALLS